VWLGSSNTIGSSLANGTSCASVPRGWDIVTRLFGYAVANNITFYRKNRMFRRDGCDFACGCSGAGYGVECDGRHKRQKVCGKRKLLTF